MNMTVKTTTTAKPVKIAKRCSCCGKLVKATTHMYGPRDFNRKGVSQGNGLCSKCYTKYTVGRTQLVGGRSGVTITQLVVAITENINTPEVLAGLRRQYPQSFNGAVRYLHAADRRTVEALFGVHGRDDDPAYDALVAKLQPKRSGVTGTQVLRVMTEAVLTDDRALMTALYTYFPQHVLNQRRYLRVAERRVVNEFIDDIEAAKHSLTN